jgi:hypothetical protein
MRTRISDRANKPEREISDQHLGKFKPEGSRGLAFIRKLCCSEGLTREALLALAHVFSNISGVPFRRDYGRRRVLIIKWFDDNIVTLEPLATVIKPTVEDLPRNTVKLSKSKTDSEGSDTGD